MRPRTASLLALALLALTTGAANAQMAAGRTSVTIATATPGGNYFLTGNAICRALQRQGHYLDSGDVTLLDCAAISTGGSFANVDLLRSRVAEVALVQSDLQFQAYRGGERFAGRKSDQMRSLLSFNHEAFQLVAGRGTRITAWPDLKGKKVNLGPEGSTARAMFGDLFKAHGIDDKWLAQSMRLPFTSHVQEMCEGNVEVIAQPLGIPNANIADATDRCGANLVNVDTPEVRKMVAEQPYYSRVVIPKGTYAGQEADITTFGVVATLVTTADMPSSVAYSIVRAVLENLADLQGSVPSLRGLKPESMVAAGLTAPLHPGAARYFKERGLPVPTPQPSVKSMAPQAGPDARTWYASLKQ